MNGKILYSIVGDNEQFSISENGTIYTQAPLDREDQSFYNLVIRASDMAEDPNKRLSSTVQVGFVFIPNCIFLTTSKNNFFMISQH